MKPASTWMRSPRSPLVGLIVLLGVFALVGGSSRGDEPAQLVVRLAALLALAYALLFNPAHVDSATRPVMIGLGSATLLVAIQLVPLPYSIWSALPGRDLYAAQTLLAGLGEIWRPLSLSPDRTWNALLALLAPLGVLVLAIKLDRRERYAVLFIVILIVLFSAAVELLRLISGGNWITLMHSTDAGGSGIFANRNHQALLLAMGLPLIATWVAEDRLSTFKAPLRLLIGAAGSITLIVLIPATGSRTGLALGGMALLMSSFILWAPARTRLRMVRRPRTRRLIISSTVAALVSVCVLALTLSRAEGVRRLMTMDVAGDIRSRLMPRVMDMLWTFFPAGSGFGGFDPVFRRFERLDDLKQTYFNLAHNDFLQIVIEGGIAAAIVMSAGLTWLLMRSVAVWRESPTRLSTRMGRLASMLLALMLAASTVDYPLRTPLIAAIFVLAAIWLFEPIEPGGETLRPPLRS